MPSRKPMPGDVGYADSSSGGAADLSRIDGMAWSRPTYTKGQVDRAGAAARRVALARSLVRTMKGT